MRPLSSDDTGGSGHLTQSIGFKASVYPFNQQAEVAENRVPVRLCEGGRHRNAEMMPAGFPELEFSLEYSRNRALSPPFYSEVMGSRPILIEEE